MLSDLQIHCTKMGVLCGVLIRILHQISDIATNHVHGLKVPTHFRLSLIQLVSVSILDRCGDVHPNPGPDKIMEEMMRRMVTSMQTSIAETVRKLINEHSERILQGTKEQQAEVK